MIVLRGKKYEMRTLEPDDVKVGALVRFANGTTSRRIIGFDGADIILRGIVSEDVLEAVDKDTLLEQWVLMEPVAEAS